MICGIIVTEVIIVRITTSKSKNSESFYIAQSYTNANGKCTSKTGRKLGTLAELSAQLHTDCEGVVEWANEFPETFQPCHPIFFLFIRRLYSLSLSTMYLVSSFSFALQNRTPGLLTFAINTMHNGRSIHRQFSLASRGDCLSVTQKSSRRSTPTFYTGSAPTRAFSYSFFFSCQ